MLLGVEVFDLGFVEHEVDFFGFFEGLPFLVVVGLLEIGEYRGFELLLGFFFGDDGH